MIAGAIGSLFSRFTGREAVVVLAIVGLSVGFLLFQRWMKEVRRADRHRRYVAQNLEKIGHAHNGFQEAHQSVVPHVRDGRPPWDGHAWTVPLLPGLEQGALYRQIEFDEPWDAPVNQEPFMAGILAFQAPKFRTIEDDRGYTLAHYAANQHVVSAPTLRVEHVTNGMSNVAFIGRAAGNHLPWGDPANVRDPMAGIDAGPHTFEGRFLMLDGSVRDLSSNVGPDVLAALSHPYPPGSAPVVEPAREPAKTNEPTDEITLSLDRGDITPAQGDNPPRLRVVAEFVVNREMPSGRFYVRVREGGSDIPRLYSGPLTFPLAKGKAGRFESSFELPRSSVCEVFVTRDGGVVSNTVEVRLHSGKYRRAIEEHSRIMLEKSQ